MGLRAWKARAFEVVQKDAHRAAVTAERGAGRSTQSVKDARAHLCKKARREDARRELLALVGDLSDSVDYVLRLPVHAERGLRPIDVLHSIREGCGIFRNEALTAKYLQAIAYHLEVLSSRGQVTAATVACDGRPVGRRYRHCPPEETDGPCAARTADPRAQVQPREQQQLQAVQGFEDRLRRRGQGRRLPSLSSSAETSDRQALDRSARALV